MSNIYVDVDEQNLTLINAPTIAAQGVNEDYIIFTFDSTWSGFGRTALFYRENTPDDVYKSAIDADGYALVPHEVTAADGRICFGVSGVKDDIIYTTEILKYRIVNGKYTGNYETVPPTPGIYEQILSAIGSVQETVEDESERLDSRIDQIIALPDGSTTADAELVDIRVGYNGTVYPSAGNAVRQQISTLHGIADYTATKTGSEITIEDARALAPNELTVQIEPDQDLNGLSRPWAIGCGKNLLPITSAIDKTENGITFTANSDGSLTIRGTATAYTTLSLTLDLDIDETFIFSGLGDTSLTDLYLNARVTIASSGQSSTYQFSKDTSFTTYYSKITKIDINITSGTTIDRTLYLMLRRASTSDEFVPYGVSNICPINFYTEANIIREAEDRSSTTYTVSFNNNISGGTLDVLTGVLTVDRVRSDITGVKSVVNGDTFIIDMPTGRQLLDTDAISNQFIQWFLDGSTANMPYESFWIDLNNNQVWIKTRACDPTVAAGNAYFTAHPLQICYKYTPPFIYELTPAEVELLAGYNRLTTNVKGSLTLDYYIDLVKYIDNKLAEIKNVTFNDTDGNIVLSYESIGGSGE